MYPIIRRRIAVLAVLTMLGGSVGVTPAAVTTFTNEADFLLAIASLVNPATDDLEVVATSRRRVYPAASGCDGGCAERSISGFMAFDTRLARRESA